VGVLGVLLLINGQAHADPGEVEGLIREGVALRKVGKDRDALEIFRRAASIQRTAHALGQMGFAEQALGLWVEAEADLRESLTLTNDAWSQKNRPNIEQALKIIGRHLGSVSLWGTPNGAEILINGHVVGTLPTAAPIRVLVGDANLVVRAKGYQDVNRPIEIQADSRSSEQVELTPIAVASPTAADLAPPRPPPSTPATTLVAEASPRHESSEGDVASPFYERWWFWTAVGVVAAGTIATVVVLGHDKQPTCSGVCTTWGGGN
jgi:hypothetical protein